MDLKHYPRRHYEIDQFTQPHCTELKGSKFYFVMDDGRDFELNFTGEDTLEWNWAGEKPKKARYQCLKGDDTTYLVDYELEEFINTFNRVNHFFIIDLEQRLVTRAICTIGDNPKFPYLVRNEYTFGAIDMEGMELPFKRHSFTTDLLGTRVEWHWNTSMITRHMYYTSHFYRITFPGAETLINRDDSNMFMRLPSTDEVAQYIKIKDKMYLFSLTEELMERAFHKDNPPYRSNDMKFLQNYDRMYHVGRTFGNILDPKTNKVVPCHILFGAFGNPVVLPESFENAPNPYTT
ncbi:MAG: MoaF N-terminal domain-containing protein [Bacillota bacterium]|nr:MoaF N-terminal domain-containing protein [Bacillota bacterium]HHU29235.1 hypothetical protein [Bacillota bacterium]